MAIATSSVISGANPGPASHSKATSKWALRAAGAATTSYVASSHMPCAGATRVGVIVTYAGVNATSVTVSIEGSLDGTNWYIIRDDAGNLISTVTLANLVSATDGAFRLWANTHFEQHVRVQLKITGTTGGTYAVDGVTGSIY